MPAYKKVSNLGYTLVEILVAISIISIAAAVAIPNLRKLGDDQAVTTTSQDIIRLLKQASANAQSAVSCSNSKPSVSWGVKFSTSGTQSYNIVCVYDNSGTLTDVNSPTIPISQITMSVSCTDIPAAANRIDFNSITEGEAKAVYPCTGDNVFSIKLQSQRNSQIDFVKIKKGGVIYETTDLYK